MINFKNLFNNENTPVGLTSMGLSKKAANRGKTAENCANNPQNIGNSALFTSSMPNYKNISLNFNQKEVTDALNNLFGNSQNLNLNKNGFID